MPNEPEEVNFIKFEAPSHLDFHQAQAVTLGSMPNEPKLHEFENNDGSDICFYGKPPKAGKFKIVCGQPRSAHRSERGAMNHRALGRLPAGEMNKTEAAYAAHLELRKRVGEVVWYKFEALKFRLADRTHYSPDFAVMLADGQLECHEVKGFWEDDARIKIKVVAEMYPLQFIAIKKSKQGWEEERF